MHQPALATVSSNACSKMLVQIMHSIAYLHNLIPTLAGVFDYFIHTSKVWSKSFRCAGECFICTWFLVHVFQLTVVKSWLVHHSLAYF